MPRRDGKPVWIGADAQAAQSLSPVHLKPRGSPETYDEAWLQQLLHRHPEALPVEQIAEGFGTLIPLCRELVFTFGAGRSGALDNMFITPQGRLVLVEAKLWRNPEARRSVVAQAMEYAAALFRLTYEEFQTAVLKARARETQQFRSLYEMIAAHPEALDESEFIDAVARNLARGRAIIAVVGDGIREDITPLAELLQTHAGHRFTFALVELAVYETPQAGVRLIIPSVLAQTALIERGVVEIKEELGGARRIVVREPTATAATSVRDRSFGIGEDEFYDNLERRDPGIPAMIKSFLAKADSLNIQPDQQRGLNLKLRVPGGKDLNFGTIDRNGFLDTSPATWWGRTALGKQYNEKLASLIGGFVREIRSGQESAVRTAAGKTPRVSDFLPMHQDAWLSAMDDYARDILKQQESS